MRGRIELAQAEVLVKLRNYAASKEALPETIKQVVTAGILKSEISQITGLSRSTVDRYLAR